MLSERDDDQLRGRHRLEWWAESSTAARRIRRASENKWGGGSLNMIVTLASCVIGNSIHSSLIDERTQTLLLCWNWEPRVTCFTPLMFLSRWTNSACVMGWLNSMKRLSFSREVPEATAMLPNVAWNATDAERASLRTECIETFFVAARCLEVAARRCVRSCALTRGCCVLTRCRCLSTFECMFASLVVASVHDLRNTLRDTGPRLCCDDAIWKTVDVPVASATTRLLNQAIPKLYQ